jgi:hypothetical protein
VDLGELPFVESLVAAPAGVALLARLEAEQRDDVSWFLSPPDSDPAVVARSARSVASMSWGRLLALAVEAAEALAGPWQGDAPEPLVPAYLNAGFRRSIALAVAARFGTRLHAPVDPEGQQWWHSDHPREGGFDWVLFRDFDSVYGCGEFTWAGLPTVSDPSADAHAALVQAWEIFPGSVSRWRLPLSGKVRVWEIHRPADWIRLVEAYPRQVDRPHGGWELPGPNQRQGDVAELLAVPDQHAVDHVERHLVPDWGAVAADYDGVHLSWAGFLTGLLGR